MKKVKGAGGNKKQTRTADATEPGERETPLRIPVLAEELVAETRLVARGAMHVHKGVMSEEQTLRVAAFHEEATVEHLSPEALGAVTASDDPNVVIIPIYEEQVVVEKRVVLKEYIRVTKRQVTEELVLHETVRRAYVDITETEAEAANARTVAGAGHAANG